MFLLISEMTPFLALPRKHVPRAQAIFVAQAGRKFRLLSLTMQRYKKFIVLPNYFSKKARKKARMLKTQPMRLKSQISVFILLPPYIGSF